MLKEITGESTWIKWVSSLDMRLPGFVHIPICIHFTVAVFKSRTGSVGVQVADHPLCHPSEALPTDKQKLFEQLPLTQTYRALPVYENHFSRQSNCQTKLDHRCQADG